MGVEPTTACLENKDSTTELPTRKLLQPTLAPVTVPVFTECRLRGAEMVYESCRKVTTVSRRPRGGEEDVVVSCRSEREWVRLLSLRVPELEESDRNVPVERVDVAMSDWTIVIGMDREALVRLLLVLDALDLAPANHIHAIDAVDGVWIESGLVEENPSEIVWESDVSVNHSTPAVVLEVTEAGVDGRSLVEVATVLLEEVGLNAPGAMFLADHLSAAVGVAGHHDHSVDLRHVLLQGDV